MGKISRTKLIDRAYNTRDAKLFIIATEGAETEQQYFGMFYDSRIKIEVLSTGEDNRSAPQYVLDRLEEFVRKYDLNEDDSLWLMFDVDRWPVKKLSEICREARKKKYHLAISNPCFESWLYLHFDNLSPDDKPCRIIEDKLREKLGSYNKSNLDLSLYKENIEEAVERARYLDTNHNHNWPHTPGTRVYKLVEILLKAIQDFS
ncbi:RloB family protein [Anabaena sp. PCC 7108]|uniref:RloB family protein n=1 Tax=Anabaena sp. PCC 7108 TaxID=163908 RepID=UPI00036E0745|nr:RloB family protein [Anabaena sp. PCC 7108]